MQKVESERAVEQYLREQVTAHGGSSFKFTSPAHRGVPDRIVIAPGGQVWFVEVKTALGKLSKLQELMLKSLQKYGCNACVVYGREAVDNLILKIFK